MRTQGKRQGREEVMLPELSHYTPDKVKQMINLLCKDRKESTNLVYTRAFRAHALAVMCDFVEHYKWAKSAFVDTLEELFADYEAAHGIYPASGSDVVFVRPRRAEGKSASA